MFPINATIAEGTYIFFKNNNPVMIIDNVYSEINIYSETYDCLCFLETLSLDPNEFKDKQIFEDNYIKIYEQDEHSVYMMEA